MADEEVELASAVTISEFNEAAREQREQAIDRDLAQCIAAGDVEVWMQPQLNYLTGEIIGSEALCRWNHPEMGAISPGEFIPALERSGRIRKLDRFVWRTACAAAHYWQEETGNEPLPFSVNVSRKEILDPDLPDHFAELRRRYNLPEKTLRIEVTETAYTTHPEELVEAVQRLRSRGFVVEMDDFGSGYSSLNMLRNLPVDALKLDMGFLRGKTNESSDGVILQSVIRMAHGLGLPVIAEGVETLEQADMLKTMGCRFMQGYYFSRPMPVDQYYALLNRTKSKRHSFAWAHDDHHVARLLDRESDTSFFFNNCIGGAIVFSVQGDRFEAMLVNSDFFREAGLDVQKADVFKRNLLDGLTPDCRDAARKAAALTADTGDGRCSVRIESNRRWIECIMHTISITETGDVLIAHVRDVTERHALVQADPLRRLAEVEQEPERDAVTGLTTRHSLDALISGSLGVRGGSFLIASIDGYADYRHAFGDAAANTLLERFGSMMRTALDRNALLARYGSGIFAAFLPAVTDLTDVRAHACELIDGVRGINLGTQPITCSIGIAMATDNQPDSIWQLYDNAIKSLYLVELNGGDSFLHHDMIGHVTDAHDEDVVAHTLRHSPDGELLPGEQLEGMDLFSIVSRDFARDADWDTPGCNEEREQVRETVLGALRYRSMAEIPGILSFDYNPADDRIILESVSRLGEVSQREIEGFHKRLFDLEDSIAEESMARLSTLLDDLRYLPSAGTVDLKCRLQGDDEFRWYRYSFTCLRDKKSLVIRGLGYGEDIDSSREASAWWKDRAMHDGLTGLLNREGLEEAVEREMKKRSGGTLYLVDIDDFKEVNERMGHLSGDSVLCTLADTLLCMFREHDVVGRYGGDEMVVFLSGVMSAEMAELRSHELLDEIDDINIAGLGNITASIGVAILDEAPEGFYDFLEIADHAVRVSKEKGKNCFTIIENGEVTHHIRESSASHHSADGFRHLGDFTARNRRADDR